MSEPGFASLGPTLLARKGGAKPAMRPQVAPLVVDETQIAALADEQLEDLGWNDMGDGESSSESEAGADVVVPINAAVAAADTAPAQSPIVHRQQRRLEERVLADAAMTGPEYAAEDTLGESADGAGEADDFDYEAWTADDAEEAEEEAYADEYDAADYAPLAPAPAPVVVPAKARRAPRAPARSPIRTLTPVAERRAAFTLRLDPERHLKLRLAATMQGVSAQALLTEALDAMLSEFDDLDVIAAHLKRH
ncbi:MAG: toxin-antitoxin system HicB family antitoxin [Porphyrobacter sp.]|jgi:hypothetical protein|nr:toxin-antitoxin system HicB family antitoxin [Porphyrobacter sp.]